MASNYAKAVEKYWGLPVPGHLKHGPNTWAAKAYGCDCKPCLPSGRRRARTGEGKSVLQRQRESRARLRGQPVPAGVKHSQYTYKVYGCRCGECRAAVREANERQDNRWRETAYGHWTQRDGLDVIHWPPADAERPWLCPDCDTKIFEEDA